MEERINMIFTREDVQRIRPVENGKVVVDLHMLTVDRAKKLLKNLIAIDLEGREIDVIHGYNHGTRIKDMIWHDLEHPRMTRSEAAGNPGLTILNIASAA